jgi:ABC-type polysaccharide/polyol phosphate transport system ATPase subunit
VQGLYKSFQIASQADTLKERLIHPFKTVESTNLEVLRDVSFGVHRGEFLGVVGRNGSGKSTLLKLLASVYRADRGRIRVAGTIAPIIELGVGFHPEMSARDNVITNALMLGLTPVEARRRFDEVIEFAELEDFVEMKLKNYSSGMRARLAFAIAVQVEPDVLLLDEVLAVGDPPFAERCHETFEALKRRRECTILLVANSTFLMERHCDRAIMLEGGRIAAEGDPSEVGARYMSLRTAPRALSPRRAPVKILKVGPLDSEGFWTEAVEHREGEPLVIRLLLDAEKKLESAQLQLWLTSSNGDMVFAPPPIPLKGEAERLGTGELVWVSIWVEHRLAGGRYGVHALVTNGKGPDAEASEIASSAFSISANGQPETGFVSLNYAVETQAVGPPEAW